jgi:ribosome-binding factor A
VATAYYTVLGEEADQRLAAKALSAAAGHVQSYYAPHVRTRILPRLRFRRDEQEVKRQRMDALIAEARASDPDHGEAPGSAEPEQGD